MKDGNAPAGGNVASKEGTIQRKHSGNQRMSKGSVKPYPLGKII